MKKWFNQFRAWLRKKTTVRKYFHPDTVSTDLLRVLVINDVGPDVDMHETLGITEERVAYLAEILHDNYHACATLSEALSITSKHFKHVNEAVYMAMMLVEMHRAHNTPQLHIIQALTGNSPENGEH